MRGLIDKLLSNGTRPTAIECGLIAAMITVVTIDGMAMLGQRGDAFHKLATAVATAVQ